MSDNIITKEDRKEFKNHIREFVSYLINYEGFRAGSIARAIGQNKAFNIASLDFGYKKAVEIKKAYINNYNTWIDREE